MKINQKDMVDNFDQEMFKQFQAGNWNALKEIYRKYRESFLYWALKWYTINEEDLKEIYQKALVIFYQKVSSGELSILTSSAKTYIFGVCKRLIHKQIAEPGRISYFDEIDDSLVKDWNLTIADKIEQDHRDYIIEKALEKLDPRPRKIIVLFYFHNYSIEAIRLKMGYKSDGVVRVTKALAMKKLRQIIGPSDQGDDVLI